MQLVHYSDQPVTRMFPVRQKQDRYWRAKPQGLWLSVEDSGQGWRDWCIEHDYGLSFLTHVHDVELAPTARILRITDVAAIDAFTAEYGLRTAGVPNYGIDWRRIAARYHGIIIAPYLAERKMAEVDHWYWSWDCASGCVWNPKAIKSITLREIVPIPG